MKRTIIVFGVVTLLPAPILVIGSFAGQAWLLAAFGYMTLLCYLLDVLLWSPRKNADKKPDISGADALSMVLAGLHFPILYLGVLAITGTTGLEYWERAVAFFAFGLYFGQVSNSNAHELIHRGNKLLHELGKWVLISLLFGHHNSAHLYVHHRFACSDRDPNSARKGENFYQFARRAWIESFNEGLKAEDRRLVAQNHLLHPYVIYLGGSLLLMSVSLVVAGWWGVATHIGLAAYATMQLLMADYVQHYGLRRRSGRDGKLEPFGPHHAWNSKHRFSGWLMLNAPKHSGHHMQPTVPYLAQTVPPNALLLPRSLPIMSIVALFPRRWRKVMDPLVDQAAEGQA